MNTPKKITGILFFLQCFVLTVLAESLPKDTIFRHLASKANYEEENIPNYALPNPLIMKNGTTINTLKQWNQKRRPELLRLFETEMFGKAPKHPKDMHFKILTEDKNALGGIATRKEVSVYLTKSDKHYFTVLIYIPNKRSGAVPLFFGLNFKGNHTISLYPGISYPTPEKQKEFREKIMDSPAFQFSGVTEPIINQKVGVNHINGIYIRPEYPVYSTAAEQVTFILNNYSGGTIECGEHYYVTFEDEKGIWRELPMNTAFVSIAYVIQDKREREMRASLYPDVHPNKAGRYRYFYEVTINRKPVLMMAEFRLSDNEKEWKEAKRTPLPEGLLTMKQDNTHQTTGLNTKCGMNEM